MVSAEVGEFPTTTIDARHNGIGDVQVTVAGPDLQDLILYGVYQSGDDAAGAVADILAQAPTTFTPPGTAAAAACFSQPVPSRAGISFCIASVGPVLVEGVSASANNPRGGNVATAVDLLRAGLAHLNRIQGG